MKQFLSSTKLMTIMSASYIAFIFPILIVLIVIFNVESLIFNINLQGLQIGFLIKTAFLISYVIVTAGNIYHVYLKRTSKSLTPFLVATTWIALYALFVGNFLIGESTEPRVNNTPIVSTPF